MRGRRVRPTTSLPSASKFKNFNLQGGSWEIEGTKPGWARTLPRFDCQLLDTRQINETQTSDLRFQRMPLRMYEVPHAWYGGPLQIVLQVFIKCEGMLSLFHYSSVKHFQFKVFLTEAIKHKFSFLIDMPF
jgi:hypothetical protein